MFRPRMIPALLLRRSGFVKTTKFKDPVYLGDPVNIVKIFNDKEVDELVVLDISATREERPVNFQLLSELASECFMPLSYGGGIKNLETISRVLALGAEKVILNSYAMERPGIIEEAASNFGSQSVVVSIDVKKTFLGKYDVYTGGGVHRHKIDPVTHARHMVDLGAGEIMINSIDRDGTKAGYDLELIRQVADAVDVPVIACGGARDAEDLGRAVKEGHASAAAAGALFVFHGPRRAVLINVPSPEVMKKNFTH